MANRHANKKLRAAVRRRMARTGESYQTARQRVLEDQQRTESPVDLVPFTYFGIPLTLVTSELDDIHAIAAIRHTGYPMQSYPVPLAAWYRPRGVN